MLTSLSDLTCFQSLVKITYQQVSGVYQLKAKDTIRQLPRLDQKGINTPEVSTRTFGKKALIFDFFCSMVIKSSQDTFHVMI